MAIILKAVKSMPKNLTDEPMILKDLIGGPINDDPIVTFASKIEKVKTRAEIEKIIKDLTDATGFDEFKLGGAIALAHDLFTKAKSEFQGLGNFREYIDAQGIDYFKAMRLAKIYTTLVCLGVPWCAFENIGWTKVRMLLDIVTKDNLKQWVAKAKELNCPSLKVHVEAEKQKGKPGTEQGPKTITTKTFKLHPDQKQVVNDAIKKAQEETGSAVEAVNLEAICQSYLGTGLMFADVAQAMAYAAKHTDDAAFFVQKQVAMMEELFPQLSIAVVKKSAPAA